MSKNPAPPMQPLVKDAQGKVRFKENKIVSFFLEFAKQHGYDLNSLAIDICNGKFSKSDYSQFSQLHGYSVCGYWELSNVPEKHKEKSERKLEKFMKENP